MVKLKYFFGSIALLGLVVMGCADDAASPSRALGSGPDVDEEPQGQGDGQVPGVGSAGATSGGDPSPDEQEVQFAFELPAASERYVYVANPIGNSVVVIDSDTLGLQTVQAGDGPTIVRTLANRDEAIVLNVNSADATLVRTEAGVSTTQNVPVVRGSNAIAAAPDGEHAVVYFDVAARKLSGSGSFQDLSVVLTAEGRSVDMTVGFRPTAVSFSESSTEAYVTTEAGVSILDFEAIATRGSHIARTVPLSAGGKEAVDVSVTADGRFAIAREDAAPNLLLAELAADARGVSVLDLTALFEGDAGAPATPVTVSDVDLTADGKFALAVVRNRSALVVLPLPDAFDDPTLATVLEFPDEQVGSVSVSPTGDRAVLYTTDAAHERVTIVDLGSGEYRVVRLAKSVLSVTIAPSGDAAMIIHQRAAGDPAEPGITPDALVDRSYGYSLVKLDDGFAKLQLTPTALGPTTVVPTGEFAFVALSDAALGLQQVQRVGLSTFLVDAVDLGSPPLSLGALPGTHKVFAGQEHPDGRITFIDWDTLETQSVTGFELNGRIRE